VRCPACTAHNPDSADWCGQCLAPLRTTPPAEEPAPAAPAAAPTDTVAAPAARTSGAIADGTPDRTSGAVAPDLATGRDRRFRRTEEGVDWRCAVCDAWTPMERTTCAVCGAPFVVDAADRGPAPGERLSETAALLTSALLPGLGHGLMGRAGAGTARAILYLTWLVGGLVLLFSAVGAGQSALPAVPLLAGAVGLWLATMADALALQRGSDTELLRPRVLLWVTVGVMGLTMLTFAAAAFSMTSGG
jgi:hypothetical protein